MGGPMGTPLHRAEACVDDPGPPHHQHQVAVGVHPHQVGESAGAQLWEVRVPHRAQRRAVAFWEVRVRHRVRRPAAAFWAVRVRHRVRRPAAAFWAVRVRHRVRLPAVAFWAVLGQQHQAVIVSEGRQDSGHHRLLWSIFDVT